MHNKTLAAITAVGLAAAIAIPSIAFGNARSNEGSLHATQVALTPFTAQLSGANEVPPAVPTAPAPVGVGAAAVTFSILDPADLVTGAQACFDISYSNITSPIMAHIHRGAAGAAPAANIVVPLFVTPGAGVGATSATGCVTTTPALATEISGNPAGFYVNVHTNEFPGGAMRGQLAAGTAPAGEAHMLPAPLRAYDSRDADGPIALNTTRTISLGTGKDSAGTSVIAVPPGSTAAIVTLTVTDTVGGGFLKLYTAALGTPPSTSSINWSSAGQNLAVTTQVAVDSAGRVKVTDGANPTDFVIDVIGYLF